MAQFWQALADGEFPVAWSNNFANYGIPLPLFAHQIPNYLGGLFVGLGLDVVLAYNIVLFIGVLASGVLLYKFLERHVSAPIALFGSIFNLLFAYRIINIYIRGALPEIIGAALFPVLLIGIDKLFTQPKSKKGFVLIAIGTAALALTHPMMVIIFGIPAAVYYCFQFFTSKEKTKVATAGIGVLAVILGALIAGYYLLPLLLEMKYFYQSLNESSFDAGKFLHLQNFIDPNWYYYYTHPGPRGHFIKLGLVELLLLGGAVGVTVTHFLKSRFRGISSLQLWSLTSLGLVLLMLPMSRPFFEHIPGFQELQYPWRFLNALQFTIPIAATLVLQRAPKQLQTWGALAGILILLVVRVPELYGKNYVLYSEDKYSFTQTNLHTQSLNPIWSGNSESYPVKDEQAAIISGDGTLEALSLKNASRAYKIIATQPVRVVDYTFYFPGWEVTVDGQATTIEFQDPNYRGVITYTVPQGEHLVSVKYTDTKIRLLAKLITLLGFVSVILISFYYSKLYDFSEKLNTWLLNRKN